MQRGPIDRWVAVPPAGRGGKGMRARFPSRLAQARAQLLVSLCNLPTRLSNPFRSGTFSRKGGAAHPSGRRFHLDVAPGIPYRHVGQRSNCAGSADQHQIGAAESPQPTFRDAGFGMGPPGGHVQAR